MAWRGSLTRSLSSAARVSISRSSQPISGAGRLRPPRAATQRFSFSNHRSLGQLGCVQSLLPLHYMVDGSCLTSHLAYNLRACCELPHGTLRRTCQDR